VCGGGGGGGSAVGLFNGFQSAQCSRAGRRFRGVQGGGNEAHALPVVASHALVWTGSYRYDNSLTRPLRTNTLYTNEVSLTYTLTLYPFLSPPPPLYHLSRKSPSPWAWTLGRSPWGASPTAR
jgi:hypothetical protein